MYMFSLLLPLKEDMFDMEPTDPDAEYDLTNYFFVEDNTRAVFLLFTIYFPLDDQWMNVVIVKKYV